MPLTLVLGPRGSGKNTFMNKVVKRSVRPVYSNFKMNHPNYRHLSYGGLLFIPKHIELLMDEFYNLADSRKSMSVFNIFCSYIAFQLRKTDTNIFVSAQQLGSIDIRYRNEWDYIVICERIDNGNLDWRLWDFGYTVYDKRQGTYRSWMIGYDDIKKTFGDFDTNEIVEPKNKSRLIHDILKNEPRLYLAKGIEICKVIKKNSKVRNQKEIKIALLRNDYDMVWSSLCSLILN